MSRKMRRGFRGLRGLKTGAWLVFLISTVLLAQDQPAPFQLRVATQLVVQTVTVTDKDGKPIEGLTAEDFLLTEDNVSQTISVFEFEKFNDTVLPPPSNPTPPVAADRGPVQPLQARITPAPPGDSRYQDRRLLVLYFDMPTLGEVERFRALTSAQTFIDKQMAASDLIAIMTYSDGAVRVRNDFTDDRSALQETLFRLLNGEDMNDIESDFGQNSGEFTLFTTDRQLAALQTAVNMLGGIKAKKSVIDFTSGMNLGGANQAQLRATLNAARRANVSFYPVDSRGLVAMAPMGDASRPSPGGIGMYTGAIALSTMRGFQRSQDALFTLAADTGGKALLDYNDLTLGIVQAQRANSSYYILGYYPTNTDKDGKLRRVKITLKNRTGELTYRETYYGDKEFTKFTTADKERQLEEALMLGDPITELTIALEVNYFQLNNAEYFVPIAVKIPGNELVLAQKAGAEKTLIDFIGEIKDEFGTTIANIRDKVEIKGLKGEAALRLASNTIQYDAGYTLLPAKYTIKFLARNAETGRIGTYQTDFVVPNLNKELIRLPISSVVLGSQRVAMTDALFTAGKDKTAREQVANPLIENGQKLIPSVTRVFSKSRDMLVYVQAYERNAEVQQPIAAFVTFYKGEQKVFETAPFAVTEGMNPKSKAVPLKLTVPLTELAPGEYICQVTVLEPTGQKAAFWQAVVKIVP
jgi:VWFA-related protein